jgi:ferritin
MTMLSTKMESALNDQINHEFNNAYTYLATAAWFAENNLPGFAHWMQIQYSEEIDHALKLFEFLIDRGGKVNLDRVERPARDFGSPKDIFAATLKLEQSTTAKVNRLYALAVEENDFATQSRLNWYVDEQVEEEKNVGSILAMLEMAGESKGTILMLDHQLGKRVKR